MRIQIDNRSSHKISETLLDIISKTIEKAVSLEQFMDHGEVSVSIVDDLEIKSINQSFRQIDQVTDVLSFPLINFKLKEKPIAGPDGFYLLGDIIISMERAICQAEAYNHSINREIGFLTAHSMLHLMGYDHENPQEEKEMFRKQEKILEELGLKR